MLDVKKLTTPSEVMSALARGAVVQATLGRSAGLVAMRSYRVTECRGKVLVCQGWETIHLLIDDPAVTVMCSDYVAESDFKGWMNEKNIQWPKLGVNCPAGDPHTAASTLSTASRLYFEETGRKAFEDRVGGD